MFDCDRADAEVLRPAFVTLRAEARSLMSFLGRHEPLGLLENNPFGVRFTVAVDLTKALESIIEFIDR